MYLNVMIIKINFNIIPCAINSRLKNELDDIKDYLAVRFTKKTTRGTKKIIIKKDNIIIQEKSKTLKEHFNNTKDLIQRNKDIIYS